MYMYYSQKISVCTKLLYKEKLMLCSHDEYWKNKLCCFSNSDIFLWNVKYTENVYNLSLIWVLKSNILWRIFNWLPPPNPYPLHPTSNEHS